MDVSLRLPSTQERDNTMTPSAPTALRLPERTAAIDARLLPEIIEMYLDAKLADGSIALDTRLNYHNNLTPWRVFWDTRADLHGGQVSPGIFQSALDWMRTDYRNCNGYQPAPNSIAHCWIRIRQVLKWAYEHGCTGPVNLVDWCPVVSFVDPDVHYPTLPELSAIFARTSGEQRLRDTAVIAFLVSTGARRYEAAHADTAAITWTGTPASNLDASAAHTGWVLLKAVKGDRDGLGIGRPVAFDSICGLLLKAYLRSVNRTAGSIFDMSDNAIGQMVDRHAHAVGAGEVSPHGFRRMLADHWDETHGLSGRAALKKQLGHAPNSADVTERHYISKNTRRVARDIAKWHVSPLQMLAWDWNLYPVHVP